MKIVIKEAVKLKLLFIKFLKMYFLSLNRIKLSDAFLKSVSGRSEFNFVRLKFKVILKRPLIEAKLTN